MPYAGRTIQSGRETWLVDAAATPSGRVLTPGPMGDTVVYAGDLTPREAFEKVREDGEAVLVDVRTDAEWRFVGVPDLAEVGKETVFVSWLPVEESAPGERFLAELAAAGVTPERGGPVVFLCRSGQRSVGAAEAATAAGIGPSYNVLDGFEGALDAHGHRGSAGWRADGLPWRQS
jgi:rhodanese-related sulfurtransferase